MKMTPIITFGIGNPSILHGERATETVALSAGPHGLEGKPQYDALEASNPPSAVAPSVRSDDASGGSPINKPKASVAPTDPWDEAFVRVEAYLHALKVEPRSLVAELAAEICKKARAVSSQHEQIHPVQLSMRLLHASFSERFSEVFPEATEQAHHQRARGRLAILIGGAAPLFGKHLSAGESCSPELCEALRQSFLQSGPELRLSKMPPAPLEFGVGDSDEFIPSTRKWVPNPALVAALLVMSAIGGVLAAAH